MATADAGAMVDVDALLWRLTRHPSALVPLPDAAKLLGLDAEAAADLLAELETLGLVESHDAPAGVSVILSALGAERIGVELWPNDAAEVWTAVWIRRGSTPPRPPVRRERNAPMLESDIPRRPGTDGASLDDLADPRAKDPARQDYDPPASVPAKRRAQAPPAWPFLILGTDVPWPAHYDPADGSCVCRGGWKRRGAVCLVCHRASGDPPDARPVPERTAGRKAAPAPAPDPGVVRKAERLKAAAKLFRSVTAKPKKKPHRRKPGA